MNFLPPTPKHFPKGQATLLIFQTPLSREKKPENEIEIFATPKHLAKYLLIA
jgi:hypothetical protein